MPAALRLNHPNRPRACRGHPWAFDNELREPPPPDLAGETAELRTVDGRLLGVGLVNPASHIVWRRYSRAVRALDDAYLADALRSALARRGPGPARRLVWSESDHLPGLVVDQYGPWLAVQIHTLALDRRTEAIVRHLRDHLRPDGIVLRNDAPIRRLEGLPESVTAAGDEPLPAPYELEIGGLLWRVDLSGGQKTGLYLDQREEHVAVAAWARGRRVLDAFCHQGGFALHCARGGAASVLALDSSGPALALARINAARNGLCADFVEANVFDFFAAERSRTWDLIVLDPPPFARSLKALPDALRGYKELHLRALQRLAPDGLLATYACSHHVGHDVFLGMIGEAAHDARRSVRVLSVRHQPADHPILPGMPESEYLRGFILQCE